MNPAVRQRAEELFTLIGGLCSRPLSLMEVCGTHTMAISRFGLRRRFPPLLRLLSGPGCPVCVTPASLIDRLIAMSREPGVVIATFGDMVRVPGSSSSLEKERARGAEVRVVYSPADALKMAEAEPQKLFVFMGVGFETTSPTVAATVMRAAEAKQKNFLVLPAFKLVPPAMEMLICGGGARVDGFICPGHVSAIIGSEPYLPIVARRVPCVITGFEALDILEGVVLLLKQLAEGRSEVEIQYRRAVPAEGNRRARTLLEQVFRPVDSEWRGIGVIPGSGLEFREEFSAFDARRRIEVKREEDGHKPEGCRCGEVMRGLIFPPDCPLFGAACTPTDPVGPCMVSSEGACAAYYRYGG